jgi:2-keto-4-pentenoate hydratase/2-oxohepta-3-ene-1,7-dioic acid hydratase in catechol pathway
MNIWGIGRNFAEHAEELGNQVPSDPIVFMKSENCLTREGEIRIPECAEDLHFEGEIALEFSHSPNADWCYSRAFLVLDLTDRKIQSRLKDQGLPWTLAKSFPRACPLSANSIPVFSLEEFMDLRFELKVNGVIKQEGDPHLMIFNPLRLSEFFTNRLPAQKGDLLLTGTPKGVGPVRPKDRLSMNLYSASRGLTPLFSAEWTFL